MLRFAWNLVIHIESFLFPSSAASWVRSKSTLANRELGIIGMFFLLLAPLASATPTISSLSPTAQYVGQNVLITGTNFGATQGPSSVTINGISATAWQWSSETISVTVPAGATTGNVIVTVNGESSNPVLFTVLHYISTLWPLVGSVGTPITISGSGFGATQGSSTVKFNGTAAAPTEWTDTSIVAPVPPGATTGYITVTVGGHTAEWLFLVFTICSVCVEGTWPYGGSVGESVYIWGSHFGVTQDASTVTFNGTATTPTSWSDTLIEAPVPAGATTGDVVVTVTGTPSNAVLFTMRPVIANLSPNSGGAGTSVTISGSNFGQAASGTVIFWSLFDPIQNIGPNPATRPSAASLETELNRIFLPQANIHFQVTDYLQFNYNYDTTPADSKAHFPTRNGKACWFCPDNTELMPAHSALVTGYPAQFNNPQFFFAYYVNLFDDSRYGGMAVPGLHSAPAVVRTDFTAGGAPPKGAPLCRKSNDT